MVCITLNKVSYMKTRLVLKKSIFLIFIICLVGCSKTTNEQPQVSTPEETPKKEEKPQSQIFKYNFKSDKQFCETGEQQFSSFESFCLGLADWAANNGCADEERKKEFAEKKCPGDYETLNKDTFSNEYFVFINQVITSIKQNGSLFLSDYINPQKTSVSKKNLFSIKYSDLSESSETNSNDSADFFAKMNSSIFKKLLNEYWEVAFSKFNSLNGIYIKDLRQEFPSVFVSGKAIKKIAIMSSTDSYEVIDGKSVTGAFYPNKPMEWIELYIGKKFQPIFSPVENKSEDLNPCKITLKKLSSATSELTSEAKNLSYYGKESNISFSLHDSNDLRISHENDSFSVTIPYKLSKAPAFENIRNMRYFLIEINSSNNEPYFFSMNLPEEYLGSKLFGAKLEAYCK